MSASSSGPKLLIAIVNYRTAPLVVQCLRSLETQVRDLAGAQVVIADNDSQDGSVQLLNEAITKEGWGAWASVLALANNGGFAAGNNAIIAPALQAPSAPDYVLLLNPDTTVLPDAIAGLVRFMSDHPEVGILGGYQQHPNGTPLRSAFRFVNPLGELSEALRFGPVSALLRRWEHAPEIPSEPAKTDWVSGGCMMVRREVLERVGLMDDVYFLYFEEMDYCLQASRAGWDTWFLPSSKIVHIGGQSTGVTGLTRRPSRRPRYWFDSRRRYYLKNFGPGQALAADALHLVGFGVWRLRRVLQGKPDNDPPSFLQDLWRNSVFVRGFELDQRHSV